MQPIESIPRWHSVSEERYKEIVSQYKNENLDGISIRNNFKVEGKAHFVEWSYKGKPFAALFQFGTYEYYWIFGVLVPALQMGPNRSLAESVKEILEEEETLVEREG
jgi:hypothetical protein